VFGVCMNSLLCSQMLSMLAIRAFSSGTELKGLSRDGGEMTKT